MGCKRKIKDKTYEETWFKYRNKQFNLSGRVRRYAGRRKLLWFYDYIIYVFILKITGVIARECVTTVTTIIANVFPQSLSFMKIMQIEVLSAQNKGFYFRIFLTSTFIKFLIWKNIFETSHVQWICLLQFILRTVISE